MKMTKHSLRPLRKPLRPLREIIFLISVLGIISSCTDQKKPKPTTTTVTQPTVIAPTFNADSAYAFVKAQCDFGPRVPGTKAHAACAEFLEKKFKTYTSSVTVQTGVVTTFDGVKLNIKNIIASFNPQSKSRVLIFAHWDTRPWADQDTARTNEPIIGADDGGSGVGVLLEIARQLSTQAPAIGIDLICFDAEDWGKKDGGEESEDSYALGTQFWANSPHIPGYIADYGILLDMVGAKGAQFRMEGFSKQHAQFVIDKVWKTASRLGYSDYFLYQESGYVTDDHVYVNRINIPSIDIIHSNPSTRSGFGSHWHTHRDNMDIIDRNTLKAVGQTLLEVIFSEGRGV